MTARVPSASVAAVVLLSEHGLALVAVAEDPYVSVRDLARAIGESESEARRVLSDLVASGCVSRESNGDGLAYVVNSSLGVSVTPERRVAGVDRNVGDVPVRCTLRPRVAERMVTRAKLWSTSLNIRYSLSMVLTALVDLRMIHRLRSVQHCWTYRHSAS
jgi:hypothetical protein